MLLLGVFLLQPSSATEVKQARRVLIFYEAGTTYPGIRLIDEGIRAAFETSPYKFEVYREYMDTILFPDPADQQRFRDFYFRKYQNRRPDVIITVGPSPLKFMLETHRTAFPGVPIIFLNWGPSHTVLDSDFTGVETDLAPFETVEAALSLLPATRHIFVITGTSFFDRWSLNLAKDQLKSYEADYDLSYLTDLTMPDLLERLKRLPDKAIVLFVDFTQDAAGTKFTSGDEASAMVTAAANVPVFSTFLPTHGEVGGKVIVNREQGRISGNLALRVLAGEKPQDIPVVKNATFYMFDWRALKRWGLEEKNLPPGSIVLNRQPTAWESYRGYIIAGVSLMLFEALLISGLMWQRARRRRAETVLAESEQRFRLVANSAPVMIWMSGPDKLVNYVNQTWLDFTGRFLESQLEDSRLNSIHPEDLQAWLSIYRQSFDRQEPFQMQYRMRRHTGDYRWILDMGVPRFNSDGSFAGYIGSCIDITDRKTAEEALSSVSRRLIEAQEQERKRIARELHDDINQRIAMLLVDLDLLQQRSGSGTIEIPGRLHELSLRLSEISSEIQVISHRLHSSKLELLGLVVACKSFCREAAERHKVTVDLRTEDIPTGISRDVSLCLFRVLQESLNNAIKHSGVQHFEVKLRGIRGEIELTVRDCGIGLDVRAAMDGPGLGLVSMRERVSLVKGTLLITSKPMEGTQIAVCVPVVAENPNRVTAGTSLNLQGEGDGTYTSCAG